MAPAQHSLGVRLLSEFVGTYALVFTMGCVVLTGNAALWCGAFMGTVLMVATYALGRVSGANFNPAVTIALGAAKALGGPGMTATNLAAYICVQLVAGISAAYSYDLLLNDRFMLAPANDANVMQMCLVEMLYTCLLCFVVLNCGVARRNSPNPLYGVAVGCALFAGTCSAGAISGGCFNPAMAVGIDVGNFGFSVQWCLWYLLAQVVGALLAAILFRLVRPEDFGGDQCGTGAQLTSEFLGSFVVVVTVGLDVVEGSVVGVLPIAAAFLCMNLSLGNVSGAQFNPGLTVATLLSHGAHHDLEPAMAAWYIVAQLAGGLCAGGAYVTSTGGFAFRPFTDGDHGAAVMGECVVTCSLCYLVLCLAVGKTRGAAGLGLAMGACAFANFTSLGEASNGLMNPAISFGISCAGVWASWPNHNLTGMLTWGAFSAAELIGSVLAAIAFNLSQAVDLQEGKDKQHVGPDPFEGAGLFNLR